MNATARRTAGVKMTLRVCRVTTHGTVTDDDGTVNATQRSKATAVDLEEMRETVLALLNPDGSPAVPEPADPEAATLTELLRGHLQMLAPEVEAAVGTLPDSIARYCALACIGEARDKLRTQPVPRPGGSVAYARRLARVLHALCEHHERMCGRPG
ncbi:DUF6415 family natural product biosynthesis protein [Streptomyces sp. WG7]|uniref:DUF6415 family natural product biosynthesis protein n=1 Tax=Streptomyces sp. WG7 TaxID=3417650 RepID=UPI003CF4EE21